MAAGRAISPIGTTITAIARISKAIKNSPATCSLPEDPFEFVLSAITNSSLTHHLKILVKISLYPFL